ncbi:MAG: glycosyltransferase family 2 protein [Cetobacterium sp.]
MIKVSIIIPIYNGEDYIESCIESIRKQRLEEFEVILINDGSTDNTGNICDVLSKHDTRIKVYHQINKGVSEARNLGLKKANGEYITFIDVDDEISNNYLETLYNLAIKKNKKLVMCSIVSMKENKEIISKKSLNTGNYNYINTMVELLNFKNLNSGPCGKLIHNSIFNYGLKFPEMKVYEDLIFSFELINIEREIYFTDKAEYYYIHRIGVGTMDNFIKEPTIDVIVAIRRIIEYLKDNQLIEILDNSFYSLISQIIMYIGDISKLDVEWNKKQSRLYIHETQKLLSENRKFIIRNKEINQKERVVFIIFSFSSTLYKWVILKKINK